MLANITRGPTAAINVQCHRTGKHRNRYVPSDSASMSDLMIPRSRLLKGQDQDEFVEKFQMVDMDESKDRVGDGVWCT
jgi:hypothetical protein